MKILLIAVALAAVAGLVPVPVAYAIPGMSPWQLFQHLCLYVSPGSPQCIQQPHQAITAPPPSSVQQQPTTPYCTTNPSDPACQQLQQQQQPTTPYCTTNPSDPACQQLQQQQAGPPPDGP
jgi:hypothetical protein